MNDYSISPFRRRWRRAALVAAAAGALLLCVAVAPALGSDRVIFDPVATPTWIQEYWGPGSSVDRAQDVVMAPGGVTYVVGGVNLAGSSDATLMKYVNGAPAWAAPKLYNGPNGGDDFFSAVALGPDNSIYTAGERTAANGLTDLVVVKWSPAGVRRWTRAYDSPTHSADSLTAMTVDALGNVTVAGVALDDSSGDWLVVNWSPSGVRRWTHRLNAGPSVWKVPRDLVATSDRNVYATGGRDTPGESVALTVRYSATGERTWTRTYRGPAALSAWTDSVVARPGGGVFVAGATMSAGTGVDGLVMSYTKAGARDVFALDTGSGGASRQVFEDLDVASTGQVVAVGTDETPGGFDCRLVIYATNGAIARDFSFPGPWRDEFVAVAADEYGGFYATGTYHTAADKTAIATLRGSVIVGGGGFTSLWAPSLLSEMNEATAIAVQGTTACVVGRCVADAARGPDQVALWYVY